MTSGMVFLGGFLIGSITAFIVLAVPMRTRYWELKLKYEEERRRRMDAEDSDQCGALRASYTAVWGAGIPYTGVAVSVPPEGSGEPRQAYTKPELVDLTDVDDPFLLDKLFDE
jgi:hypothetical protein